MTLGTLMREKREELNLTQKDIAEQIDVSVKTIENWESDEHQPNPDKFNLIVNAYHINQEDFMKAYMEPIFPIERQENEENSVTFLPTSESPLNIKPLSKSDFADNFPTEWFSDRMLQMLRELKFSAEEVELWRMLDVYVDCDWHFADCWEEGLSDEYTIAPKMVKYLPKEYVVKTGVGNILNMIYDIQSKLPNNDVEDCLDDWICPDLSDVHDQEEDVQKTYLKAYSVDGFDINNVDFYELIDLRNLIEISSEEYHGLYNPTVVFNRVTPYLTNLLVLIAKGDNIVFDKDLNKKYNRYEYFNPKWWPSMMEHMEDCIFHDREDLSYPIDLKSQEDYHQFYENTVKPAIVNAAQYVDFWTKTVGKNQTEEITGGWFDNGIIWNDTIETIPSPFPDWIEFHYEKTDDKLICTASLTKKGVLLCADNRGWETFINENTVKSLESDEGSVPYNIYMRFADIVIKYHNSVYSLIEENQTDSDLCKLIEENHKEINDRHAQLESLIPEENTDMPYRDLKILIELGIYWGSLRLDCAELMNQKMDRRHDSVDYAGVFGSESDASNDV